MTPSEGRDCGRRRGERGIRRGAHQHEAEIRLDMLRRLDAMLAHPDGTATSDDTVDDLLARYRDGGKWRGAVTTRLRAAELVEFVGWVVSARRSRHGGYVQVWRLTDRDAAIRYRDTLRAEIAAESRESADGESPAA